MAYVGTPIDTRNTFQSLVGKRFSGNASTTAFTLDVAPSSTLDIEVFVENVRQDPNSAYSLSGTTLTFAAAPPSGTNNIYVVHQAKAVGTISPAAGTVNADSFDNTVISGHDALTSAPADTDEFLISDAGTIKRIDYSLIKGGITMANNWRLSADFTGDAGPIASNLEIVDTAGQGTIGSAMTVSSGVFTFPSTGIYLVRFNFMLYGSVNADTDARFSIYVTTNNSSYTQIARGFEEVAHEANTTGMVESLIDVTDTSNVKVRFDVSSNINLVRGSSSQNQTSMMFIRLGDT